ncbi:hypothetical protein D3C86_2131790 [compost metagenome]
MAQNVTVSCLEFLRCMTLSRPACCRALLNDAGDMRIPLSLSKAVRALVGNELPPAASAGASTA